MQRSWRLVTAFIREHPITTFSLATGGAVATFVGAMIAMQPEQAAPPADPQTPSQETRTGLDEAPAPNVSATRESVREKVIARAMPPTARKSIGPAKARDQNDELVTKGSRAPASLSVPALPSTDAQPRVAQPAPRPPVVAAPAPAHAAGEPTPASGVASPAPSAEMHGSPVPSRPAAEIAKAPSAPMVTASESAAALVTSVAAEPSTVAAVGPGAAPTSSQPRAPPGPPPLLWNAWAESLSHPYSPVKQLKADAAYRVRVHMSAVAYGDSPEGVALAKVSDTARRQFDEWIATLPADQKEVELDALIIVDSAIFVKPEKFQQKLKVNLARLRVADRFAKLEPKGPRPLEKLQKNPEQPFVFGETDFQLRTSKNLPPGATRAPIAISIWSSPAGVPQMPIDEVAFALCIAGAKCEGAYPAQYGYGGFNALRATQAESSPEAGIHLVEMLTGDVFGVFRQKEEAKYYTWPLKRRLDDLRKGIENDLKGFREGDYPTQLAAGAGLLRRLIPEDLANVEAREAYKAFASFVASRAKKTKPYDSDDMPSIFFRIASATPQEPAVWPLAIMAVRSGLDEGWFLGRYFRIESPLTNQSYASETGCLEDWQVVGPATDGDTRDARLKLPLGRDDHFVPNRTLQIGAIRVPILDKMALFGQYVSGESDLSDGPVSLAPVLLSVLSHHAQDRVYFLKSDRPVYASNIRRRFAAPSAVILNGCGTGLAGASGFIDALNRNGVHAAIATVADVEATMAGDFLACFIEQVRTGPDDGQPIGMLHTRTLRCMEAKEYGAKALVYGLLGNSGLRICKPRSTTS